MKTDVSVSFREATNGFVANKSWYEEDPNIAGRNYRSEDYVFNTYGDLLTFIKNNPLKDN